MKRKVKQSFEFSEEKVKTEILQDAKSLHLPLANAEVVAEKVATATGKWVAKRATVTQDDIWRRVAVEIAKYNSDLAYVYQNRGKII